MKRFVACVIVLWTATAASPAEAQLQLAVVGGTIVDDSGGVIPGATVELTDPLGAPIMATATDAGGKFAFSNVAPGRYQVRAAVPGFAPMSRQIDVTSALPIQLMLHMTLRTAITEVIIDEGGEPDNPSTRASIAADSLTQVPVRAIARGIQDAVATLPGWATEDNGLLHVRGTDDGFLYVIDGVPIYERLDQVSSLGPNLTTVESINVRTGFIPAEFGYKAGGVIDIRSKTFTKDWNASLQVDQASDRSTSASAMVGGPAGSRWSMTIGAAGQRSDRFLDPIHPDNFHNAGNLGAVSSQIMWLRPDTDFVTASFNGGRSSFEVPNSEDQQDAGQDQRQRLAQANASISWQRVWNSNTYSQLAGYLRHSSSELNGSEFDTPLFANADRTLQREGVIAGISRRLGRHDVKAGFEAQRLILDEDFQFVRARGTALGSFAFRARATPSPWAGFVQSDWQATASFILSAGLRFDESRMLLARRQFSPRAGVAYRVANDTVIRGSASRFFQPPQPENLLLASSDEARVLSPFAGNGEDGGADVEPERQWGFEAGVDHRVGRYLRIDAAAWYRTIENVADPNVFAGTTIIFPNAVAEGRARGLDVRLEMSPGLSWSGYVNAALGRVRQRGPIVGGLFLEDDVAELAGGTEFVPDHDQRVVAGGGVTWRHARSGATVSASARYETGTPIQRSDEDAEELETRAGAALVDFEKGRVRPRAVVSVVGEIPIITRSSRAILLRASILNAFDASYAYNFGNPFSGTHFGAPRTLSAGLRARF